MIEVASHSLFGKHNYAKEQTLLLGMAKELDLAVALVSPLSVEIPLPSQYLPAHWKRVKIKEHLTRARELLERIGV